MAIEANRRHYRDLERLSGVVHSIDGGYYDNLCARHHGAWPRVIQTYAEAEDGQLEAAVVELADEEAYKEQRR